MRWLALCAALLAACATGGAQKAPASRPADGAVEVEDVLHGVKYSLPPAPEGYMHTVIGGHIALVNRRTFFVLDVFHFEL